MAHAKPVLSSDNFGDWLEYLRPKAEETAFNRIDFFTTLWEAVVEANRHQKPVLLWAMNGHPMACT